MHPNTFPVTLARSLFLNDDLFGMVLDSLARTRPDRCCADRSLAPWRRCFLKQGIESLERTFAANLPAHVSDEVFHRFPNRVFEAVKRPLDAPFTFESLVFPVLDFLREHFLTVRETGPVVRHERIEEYGALARSVDPAMLAARHLLVEDRWRNRGRRDAARARFRRPLPRDNRVPPGTLIDNHIHLRGTAPAGAYLIAHLEEAGPAIDGGPRADADAARDMGLLRLLYGEVLRALDFPQCGGKDPSPGRILPPDDAKYLATRLTQMKCAAAPPYPRPRHSLRAILYRGLDGRAGNGPAALLSLAAAEWDAGRPESAWGCVIAAVLEGAAAGNAAPSALDRRLALAFLLQASRVHSEIHGSRRAGLRSFVKTFGHKLREVTDEAKVGVDTAALRALRSADCDHAELRYDLKPSKIDPARFLLRLVARRTAVDLTDLNDLADIAGAFDPATAKFMTVEERFTKAVHEGCRSWHFGHHFIHEGDGASGSGGGKRGRSKGRGKRATCGEPMILHRHAKRRRELWDEATRLDEWFGAVYGSRPLSSLVAYLPDLPPHLRARLQMGPMGRSLRVDPRALLRTLDAAGDENLTPPEVYAPAVRFLRRERSCEPACPARAPARRPLQLAFHAGEDFRHPVSGMRRIDETIRFLRYRSGDRLGHALALGVRPRDWMRRMPEAAIDRHSHLDNLVWLWRRCRELIGLHPDAAGYIARYEIRAMKEAEAIYGKSRLLDRTKFPLSMDALHQAWKLRGDCPESLLSTRRRTLAGVKDPRIPSMHAAASREEPVSRTALEIYRAYHHCPQVGEKGEEIVILRHEPTLPAHCGDKYEEVQWIGIDDQELDLWEAVQDLLLARLAELGIVIEANPSSNIQIGVEDTIRDHPVFRWNPPDPDSLNPGADNNRFGVRRGPNRVCINSDDPGIFASPLRDEYESLRRHALSIRVSPTVADRWLDELRGVGLEVFEANHLDPIIPFQSIRYPPRPAARAPS